MHSSQLPAQSGNDQKFEVDGISSQENHEENIIKPRKDQGCYNIR